jgi:hypothetical protein
MVFTIEPTAGSAGTLVMLTVSGCIDPSGNTHDVVYRPSHGTTVHIPTVQHGTSLTATYRVTGAVRPAGRFTATCLDTYVTRDFSTTS